MTAPYKTAALRPRDTSELSVVLWETEPALNREFGIKPVCVVGLTFIADHHLLCFSLFRDKIVRFFSTSWR